MIIENTCVYTALNWYALQVRTNFEKVVATLLRAKECEAFAPTYCVRRRWSDRIQEMDVPLFPGYIFCRCDWNSGVRILSTAGVIRVLGTEKPTSIPDSEIEAIQVIVNSRADRRPCDYLAEGEQVEICGGPLRGLRGFLISTARFPRLVCSVTLLQRSVLVELSPDWLIPMREPGSCLDLALHTAGGDRNHGLKRRKTG
jgi:transcription antitermination factor NusG